MALGLQQKKERENVRQTGEHFNNIAYNQFKLCIIPGSIPGAGHLFPYVTKQPPKANSAFHPPEVGK